MATWNEGWGKLFWAHVCLLNLLVSCVEPHVHQDLKTSEGFPVSLKPGTA